MIDRSNQLHADGCAWHSIAPHLRLSVARLRQLRSVRTAVSVAAVATPTLRITTDSVDVAPRQMQWHSLSIASSAISLESAGKVELGSTTGTQYWAGEWNGVFVAFGVPATRNPQRFTHEGRRISRPYPNDRIPIIEHDVTVERLQDLAARRPFILHLVAHRSSGAVLLGDADGREVPVLDDDLVRLLAPSEYQQPAVLILGFCNSVDVATRLHHHRDMAVVSFEGELTDEAAFAFDDALHGAMNLGRTIGMAFEAGRAAIRGAYGIETHISPPSSAHDRVLPQ